MTRAPILIVRRDALNMVKILQHKEIYIFMRFHPNDRTALFIDGANFYGAAKSLNFDVDYRRLYDFFASKTRLVRAVYYTALFDDQDYSPLRPLVDWLDYNGFTVVTKQAREFTDAQGRRRVKGDMSVDLAVDVMALSRHLDHVVLFSGDGVYRALVDTIQRDGVRVSIVSTIKSQPPMIADDLRRQADQFIELAHLSRHIGRDRPAREDEYDYDDDADYDDDDDDADE